MFYYVRDLLFLYDRRQKSAIEDEDQSAVWGDDDSWKRRSYRSGYSDYSDGYRSRNRGYGTSSYNSNRSQPGTAFARAKMDPAVRKMINKTQYNGFGIGDRVKHIRFGTGSVIGLVGQEKDARIRINFDGVGVKELMLSIAKLEKLS